MRCERWAGLLAPSTNTCILPSRCRAESGAGSVGAGLNQNHCRLQAGTTRPLPVYGKQCLATIMLSWLLATTMRLR